MSRNSAAKKGSAHHSSKPSASTASHETRNHRSGQHAASAAPKGAPLASKSPNVAAPPQERKKAAAVPEKKQEVRAHSTASTSSHTAHHKPSGARYITIKAIAKRNLLRASISDILKNDRERDVAFQKFITKSSRNRLITSYMPESSAAGQGGDDDGDIEDVPVANVNYLNMLNLNAFGNFSRMYTEITFGENPASTPVEALIDTGSAVTWVNLTAYKEAINKTKSRAAKTIKKKRFEMAYSAGSIKGDLLKDKIRFCGIKSQEVVLNHVFGVVDEKECPDALRWRTEQDINAILGLGHRDLAKDVVKKLSKKGTDKKTEDLPTVPDRLKAKGYISSIIIGIHYRLPDEGKRQPDDSSSHSSGSNAGIMVAEFHIGGIKASVFKEETHRTIPATIIGDSARYGGVDLELKYENEVVMPESHGIIDTGAEMIGLPGSILDAYFAMVNKSAGRDIVKYDQTEKIYYMKKEDFGLLKPLEFNFKKGSNALFSFEPRQQVYPPAFVKKLVAEDQKGDHLYFIFRRLDDTQGSSRKFSLGQLWSK
ncbi:hypothetical protein ACEPAI_1970 [Sanghuangporus weigelae]